MAAAPKNLSLMEEIIVAVVNIEVSEYKKSPYGPRPPSWDEIDKTGSPTVIEWACNRIPQGQYKHKFLENAREFIVNGKEYLLLYYALCFIFPNEHDLYGILTAPADKPIIALVRYFDKLEELKMKYKYTKGDEDANLKKYFQVVQLITLYLTEILEKRYSSDQIDAVREIIRLENISRSHSARVKKERGVGNYYTNSNESWRGSLGISEQTAANTLAEAKRLRASLPNSGGGAHRKRTHRKRAHKRTHRKRKH